MLIGARIGAWAKRGGKDPLEGRNAIVYDILDTESDFTVAIENISRKISNVPVTVDWGDGTTSSVSTTSVSHTYATAGRYVAEIDGNAKTFGSKQKNTKVVAMYWAEGTSIGDAPNYPARECTRLEKAFWITGISRFPQYGFYGDAALVDIGPLSVFTDFSRPASLYGTNIVTAEMTNATGVMESVLWNNTSVTDVDIGNATTLVGTFYGCSSLKSVKGIEGVTRISGANTFYLTKVEHLNLQMVDSTGNNDLFRNSSIKGLYLPRLTSVALASLRNMPSCKYVIVPNMSGCTSATGQVFTGDAACEYYGPFIESGDFGIFGINWWSNSTSAPDKTDADGNTYKVVVEFRAMTCAEIISGERWDQSQNHAFPYGFFVAGRPDVGLSWVKFVGSDGYVMYRDGAWRTYLYSEGYTREDYYAKYLAIERSNYPEDFEQ